MKPEAGGKLQKAAGGPARKTDEALAGYAELRRRVRETLLGGQQRIEEARVGTYWETGWWIKEHILRNRYRARHGEEVLTKLSRDEGVSVSVLDRCRQFSEKFPKLFPEPIFAAGRNRLVTPYPASKNGIKTSLTWSHFRTLLPLEDQKLRLRLARQAVRQGWTVPELETRIQSLKKSPPPSPAPLPQTVLLKPKKGELFTYRIVKDAGVLALDHGFAKYWNLTAREAGKFHEGDIVRKPAAEKVEKIKNGTAALLYTYEADVIRVVDGDTIWMKIYLEGRERPPWVKEKLRLRDIDAPEIKTAEGKAAKKFVEEAVMGKQTLITTTKPDKWDRYLSDVFLIPPEGEEIYLNNLLLEKGHARIKTDWSLDDWEM